ncbi:hypothetical protein [uncultured Croceitalea sp.]|uniref:hypothetical protein n=1 Tax=uncultured Croceitalea sp. TaxID=1798908 RepID=UPI00374E825B
MKALIFSYKFLFLTFMSLPLALCSSDNETETETEIPFESVTIDLGNTNVTLNDTMFELQGFLFRVERVESTTAGGPGILLAFPNENDEFSFIELDLMDTRGISKITISLFNNCRGCLDIQVLNGSQIITEVPDSEIESAATEVIIDVDSEISALRIASVETTVNKIKLE